MEKGRDSRKEQKQNIMTDGIKETGKSKISVCKILGVDIAAVNMRQLVSFTCQNIRALCGEYICVANVHTTVMAFESEEYRKIQNGSIMTIPDGGPLASLGKKRGSAGMSRTAGPDYMGEIFQISAQHGYRHYFYGSKEETLQKLRNNLETSYPGIQIVGMCSPPFRELTREEDERAVQAINEARPDFIWVGLGAPKQEKWMSAHKGIVNGLMVGVGAGFDYFAGNIRRAPKWMQEHNLEWLYRLWQEPMRLSKRYLVTNVKFIWHAALRGR